MAEAEANLKVRPRPLFDLLVNENDSMVKLPNDRISSYFQSGSDPVLYFKKNPQFFMVFENEAGEEVRVGARVRNFKLCTTYGVKGSYCNEDACTGVHCCRDWIAGECEEGVSCKKAHHFQSKHNKTVLEACGFERYMDEKLRHLLRVSLAQVCRDFNRTGCENDEACPDFHVCEQFVRGTCVKLMDENHTDATSPDDETGKLHRFDSSHSKRLLKAYEMESCSPREILDALALVRTRQENPVRIRQLIHKMRPDRFDLPDLKELIEIKEIFRPKVKVTTKQREVRELGEEEIHALQGDFENLRAALGDDESELMDALCYQLELENQKREGTSSPETPDFEDALDGTESQATDSTEPDLAFRLQTEAVRPEPFVNLQVAAEELEKVDPDPVSLEHLGSHQIPNQEGESRRKTPRNDREASRSHPVVATYTGYAPQDDKEYICEDSLKNACPNDAESCAEAHYISPYLWQVQVTHKWYNLDTVNEDVEKAQKQRDADYITTMPQEVPELAGKLMTIFFNKMAAELTVAGEQLAMRQVRERYVIRRLQCRSASTYDRISEVLGGRRRARAPPDYQKTMIPARADEIPNDPFVVPRQSFKSDSRRLLEKMYGTQVMPDGSSDEKRLKDRLERMYKSKPKVQRSVETDVERECESAADRLRQMREGRRHPRVGLPPDYYKTMIPDTADEIPNDSHVQPRQRIESGSRSRSTKYMFETQKDRHERLYKSKPEVERSVETEVEREREQPDSPECVWQVKIEGTWVDLTSANREIEQAYLDRAPDYATTIPRETPGGEERLIELCFGDMQATFLDTNDTITLRRNPAKPCDDHQLSVPHDRPTPENIMRISRLKKFSAVQKPEQTTNIEPTTVPQPDTTEAVTDVNDLEPSIKVAELDEKPRDEIQSSGGHQSPEVGPKQWQWSWSTDFKTWTPHDEEYSECLEAAYLADKKTGTLRVNGEKIKIDFSSMVETTKRDNKTRLIRRHAKC